MYYKIIIDIVMLGMKNEGGRKYLDVQSVFGRRGLLRTFEHVFNADMSRTFRRMYLVRY
jgi:hypothetical protein